MSQARLARNIDRVQPRQADDASRPPPTIVRAHALPLVNRFKGTDGDPPNNGCDNSVYHDEAKHDGSHLDEAYEPRFTLKGLAHLKPKHRGQQVAPTEQPLQQEPDEGSERKDGAKERLHAL